MKRKVLLLTHDMSFSGAPKMMLLLWEEIKKKYHYDIDVISLTNQGYYKDRFRELSHNFYLFKDINKSVSLNFIERINEKFFKLKKKSSQNQFFEKISNENYDFIFANTIVTLPLAFQLKSNFSKLILNVHELDTVLEEFLPNIIDYESKIDLVIVPSQLNLTLLEKKGISGEKIKIVRDCSTLEVKKNNFFAIEEDVFRVLGCGAAYWRKGDDLFIQLAKKVKGLNSKIKFYWVGPHSSERKRVNCADRLKLNLEDTLFFLDEIELSNLLPEVHLFALTSREDPFPLAAVEAGMVGLPITCFRNATGISEVITDDLIADYLDIDQMANIIIDLFNDKSKYKIESDKNRNTFQKFETKTIASEVVAIINDLL